MYMYQLMERIFTYMYIRVCVKETLAVITRMCLPLCVVGGEGMFCLALALQLWSIMTPN